MRGQGGGQNDWQQRDCVCGDIVIIGGVHPRSKQHGLETAKQHATQKNGTAQAGRSSSSACWRVDDEALASMGRALHFLAGFCALFGQNMRQSKLSFSSHEIYDPYRLGPFGAGGAESADRL